jgi:thymidylate synthase (FAD)
MNVNLVSLTDPKIGSVISSAEEFIVYCARVSNPINQLNTETSPKLLNYLIKHKHWSPFEMASMTVEIETSRAIAAQILRHRSFSFQEFSQRYSNATTLEDIEWRMQGKTNRQVGDDIVDLSPGLDLRIKALQEECLNVYNEILKKGIAKECARMILPLNTSTRIYMTGNIRSWIHYVEIRSEESTQKEHRDIALKIKDILIEKFPNTSIALGWL